MTFSNPNISNIINIGNEYINTLVIENRKLFYDIVLDIVNQTEGNKGKTVIGFENRTLDFEKKCEIFTSFTPFDINRKSLVSKIVTAIEKNANSSYNYEKTMSILTSIEGYLNDIIQDFDCDLLYSKLSVSTLLKSVGIEISDDYSSLAEKIIDYMELVREFDSNKLFIFVNMRSYVDDEEMELFFQTIISHEFQVLLLDNREYEKLKLEHRTIIDDDLCEI